MWVSCQLWRVFWQAKYNCFFWKVTQMCRCSKQMISALKYPLMCAVHRAHTLENCTHTGELHTHWRTAQIQLKKQLSLDQQTHMFMLQRVSENAKHFLQCLNSGTQQHLSSRQVKNLELHVRMSSQIHREKEVNNLWTCTLLAVTHTVCVCCAGFGQEKTTMTVHPSLYSQ